LPAAVGEPSGEPDRILPLKPFKVVVQNTVDTTWTASWKQVKALRAESVQFKCVEKGGSCKAPALAASATLPPKTTSATVELYPDSQYTCYVVAEGEALTKCSKPVSIKTDYVSRAYLLAPVAPPPGRRLQQMGPTQRLEVCGIAANGSFVDCMDAGLGDLVPFSVGRNAAAVDSSFRWITFLDQNDTSKAYTCPLNPDGTAVADSCRVVFTAGGMDRIPVYNDQSTKVWIRNAETDIFNGTVCDINAGGDYVGCQQFLNEDLNSTSPIVPSPDGQNVYVFNTTKDIGQFYCNEIVQDCVEVEIIEPTRNGMQPSPPPNVFDPSRDGIFGFLSSDVALTAFGPLPNSGSFERLVFDSPIDATGTVYSGPFNQSTIITGILGANGGDNAYVARVFIKDMGYGGRSGAVANQGAEPLDLESAMKIILEAWAKGDMESLINNKDLPDFEIGWLYCTVGMEALTDCVEVVDFLEGREITAFTQPIIV